jgi:hypothetical protein
MSCLRDPLALEELALEDKGRIEIKKERTMAAPQIT